MRLLAWQPITRTLCALVTAGLVAASVALTSAPAAQAAVCQAAPPPAIDSSEALTPGETSPVPLPEPATPAGGPLMAECGYVLPPGAPALPKDLGFESWVLQDLDTGAILAARDPHARQRPASLIKLLLAQVVARELNPNTVIIGTQADADQQGTRIGIGPGGHYTVGLLVKALLMGSGNDAAYALAVQLGGPQAAVDKMNALARQLGAADTRAATPSGLDGPGMSASAYDLSVFLKVDMATPMLAAAMHTVRMPFPGYGKKPGFTLNNDNLLLRTYPGDLGGKSGFTDDAQQTYADAAEQGGHRIALVMTRGTNHLIGRWQNARELMNYGFALENAHFAPVGQIVPLAAGSTSANNVVTHAPAPTTGARLATVPPDPMSTFGNVGLPLTILAALALVLIGLLYLRRQKAKKARAAAAARVAAAETVRVALPRDLATRRNGDSSRNGDGARNDSARANDGGATRSFESPPTTRQRPPGQPTQGQPSRHQPQTAQQNIQQAAQRSRGDSLSNGRPVPRPQHPSTGPQPTQRPASRPGTTPPGPEWPTGPDWPT